MCVFICCDRCSQLSSRVFESANSRQWAKFVDIKVRIVFDTVLWIISTWDDKGSWKKVLQVHTSTNVIWQCVAVKSRIFKVIHEIFLIAFKIGYFTCDRYSLACNIPTPIDTCLKWRMKCANQRLFQKLVTISLLAKCDQMACWYIAPVEMIMHALYVDG